MFPSDPTFNELHIREKQMLLGAILIWLNDCAQYAETHNGAKRHHQQDY